LAEIKWGGETFFVMTALLQPGRKTAISGHSRPTQLLIEAPLDQKKIALIRSPLGGEPSAHLKREVPKEKYSTTPEWVQAVKREIDEVLLQLARAETDSPDHLAAKAAEFITTDRILEDLALEERLDAMVDRAMRRLAQMKFMKQISGSRERQLQGAAALQIEGPPKPKRQKRKVTVK
jgi:hypothetical protein